MVYRRLDEKGHSLKVETSLITLKLRERIIRNLEDRHRKTGMNDEVSWRGIWIELGGSEEDFCKALTAGAGSDGPAEIVFVDSDHIKLGSKVASNTKINEISLQAGAYEQLYGLAMRFVRFFLQFVKQHRADRTQTAKYRIGTSARH